MLTKKEINVRFFRKEIIRSKRSPRLPLKQVIRFGANNFGKASFCT